MQTTNRQRDDSYVDDQSPTIGFRMQKQKVICDVAHHATPYLTKTFNASDRPRTLHARQARRPQGQARRPQAELNGLSATIESFVEATGRYNVKLDDGTVLALKPENLEQLPTTQTTTASTADADERAVSVRCSAALWYPDEPSLASATTLKLTLSSKQLKKPLSSAVIEPFLKAFNRRVTKCAGVDGVEPPSKLFILDDIAKASVDGAPLSDLTISSSVVLMPRRVVSLELTLAEPPPPPPLLHKNVALTGLDTTAYMARYNGMWAQIVSYDAPNDKYTAWVCGDKHQVLACVCAFAHV